MSSPGSIDPDYALLCCWDALYQREHELKADQVAWDIIALPLLFGPIALQDNMVVVSPAVLKAVHTYPSLVDIMRIYAEEGILGLWHRPTFGLRKLPVRSFRDVVSDFARRVKPDHGLSGALKTIDTFDMILFTEEENAQIRGELEEAGNTGSDDHDKLETALDDVVFRRARTRCKTFGIDFDDLAAAG